MKTISIIRLKEPGKAGQYSSLYALGEGKWAVTPYTLEFLKKHAEEYEVLQEVDVHDLEERIVYPVRSFLYSTPDEGALAEICAKMLASQREGKFPYAVFLGRNPNLESDAFFLDRAGGLRKYQWRFTYEKPQEKRMSDSFPKFLRMISDPDVKFVLSFGSGGLRLFAQPSMMKFINDINAQQYVDEVWGCSGGSLSGLCYAMGVPPELMEQQGYDIYNEKFHFKLSPSFLSVLKNAIVSTFLPTPPNVLKGYVSVQATMQTALSQLIEGKKLEFPFYCVAYNVKRRRNEILTPWPVIHPFQREFITAAEPIDAVVASSSIPIIYVPKEIKKGSEVEQYIDGATAEPVPLLSIYRKWVADRKQGIEKRRKLVILAIDPLSAPGKPGWFMRHVFHRLPYSEYLQFGLGMFRLIMQARVRNHEELLKEDANVRAIIVGLPLKTSAMLNIKKIPKIIHDSQTVLLDQMFQMEKGL